MRIRTQSAQLVSLFLLLLTGCVPPGTITTTSTTTSSSTNNLTPYPDPAGDVATYTTAGLIDTTSPFFQTLGSNTRTCATCHQPSQAMSLNTTSIQALFASTSGTDPLFNAVDGANCPNAPTGDSASHSLLLNNGLIRMTITLPTTAQFTLKVISDPYGCALSTTNGVQTVSVYRRPLPASSLNYLTSVMWDGRLTTAPLSTESTYAASLTTDLTAQMLAAITNHEQGTATPSSTQIEQVLALEQSLYTAQASDAAAGSLSANGAQGGPTNLAALTFYPGINDSLGNDPTLAPFNPNAMTLYTAWTNSSNAQQASIARGEGLFNKAGMKINNVPGITLTGPGSCTTCHDTPNIGNRSVAGLLDTGTAHNAAAETDPNILAGLAQLSLPSLPVFQITGCTVNGKAVTYTTSDPGKALTSGLCADVSTTKVPILRGLAARAPYFHAGSAATLAQLVAFYNARFQMNLNPTQQADLVNFLNAL